MLQTLKFSANEPVARPRYKVKRSMSNALDYVSERKQLIFEPKWKKDRKNAKDKNENDLFGEHNDELLHRLDHSEIEGIESANKLENEDKIKKIKVTKPEGDDNISFNVDPDEFNKNKMVEASFISNDGILDSLKNN